VRYRTQDKTRGLQKPLKSSRRKGIDAQESEGGNSWEQPKNPSIRKEKREDRGESG